MIASCIIGAMSAVGLSATDGADIVLHNHLTGGEDVTVCVLVVDGLAIGVLWKALPGLDPDTVTITPPPGYAAFPPQVTIPEGQDYTVAIRAIPLG